MWDVVGRSITVRLTDMQCLEPRFQEVIENTWGEPHRGGFVKRFRKFARQETRLGENGVVDFVGVLSQIGRSQHGLPHECATRLTGSPPP